MAVPSRWIALVAKTPADARDYMIEGPGGILRNTPPHERPTYEPSKRRVTWPNGSWATVYSSEEADQLRGFSGDTAWLDEFAKYTNPREVWDSLQFGMREASDDMPRVVITTTPRPLPLLEELEAKSTTVVVTGSSYENRANLAPTWFAETLAAYEGTRLGQQEIHAEILDDVEGRVYPSFSGKPYPLGNVDDSVKDLGGEILVGQDFNVNPMASVIAVRAADECHVLDALEIFTSNTDEVCQEVKRRYPDRRVVFCPDPSGKARKTSAAGKTDFSIIQSYGFEIRAPNAAPAVRDRENNANAMYLKGDRRRVRVHSRAKALITALKNLQFKEGTSIRDKASGFDHVCFAADTLVDTPAGVLPIADLPPEGMIAGPLGGYVPYVGAVRTARHAQTVRVEFENGESVVCTPDHRFLTNTGWLRAVDLLQSTGYIEVCDIESLATRFRSLTGSLITSVGATSREEESAYIASSSLRFTGPSREGRTSTTLTATAPTTGPTTSFSWERARTSLVTCRSLNASQWLHAPSFRPKTPPVNGTEATKAAHGTASSSSVLAPRSMPLTTRRASSAVPRSRVAESSPPRSADETAWLHGVGTNSSTTRRALARVAALRSDATDTSRQPTARDGALHSRGKVVSVRPANAVDVYDVCVPGVGAFALASGFVVSNCDAADYLLWQEFNVLTPTRQYGQSTYRGG